MAARGWLRRRLGVWDMYALVHADSQSTFYLVVGFILLYGGQHSFLAVVYSVALMAAIALSYGEMGSRFPETGGSYIYVKAALGPAAGFLSTWLLAVDQAIMVAYGTLDASAYLAALLGLPVPAPALALALSTALFLLALVGVRESAAAASAIAAFDILVVGALVTLNLPRLAAPPHFAWGGVEGLGLLYALSLASRGFTGVDAIGQLAGEAREPLKQVPRATLLVILVGGLLAVLLAAEAMSVLRPGDVAESPPLAMGALARATPQVGGLLFTLVALNIVAIMLSAALTGYLAFSRLLYMLAEDGALPRPLGRIHPRFRTPHLALLLAYLVSLAFVAQGELEAVVDVYAFSSLVNYLLVSISLAVVARRGELHGAFSTPRLRGIPASSVTAMALIPAGIALTALEKNLHLWPAALWAAVGLLYFAGARRRREGEAVGRPPGPPEAGSPQE